MSDDRERTVRMRTKDQILALLRENSDSFLSGQQIAERLQLSRSAVWKAVRALQKEGHVIEAVTNRGYRLTEELPKPDAGEILRLLEKIPAESREGSGLAAGIQGSGTAAGLQNSGGWPEIRVYETVSSTNDLAMELADPEEKKEMVIIAGAQTAGKGRRGRSFYSPDRTGMYMSFLLYPEMDFTAATRLTCMMAEAVCRAIEAECGIETQIKWVNDIYYQDRKIVGILTEGRTSMEDGTLSYVVIGAGLNLYPPQEGFPEGLRAPAGALLSGTPDSDMMNRLYAAVITHFFALYRDPDPNAFLEGYRRRSMLIGHYVEISNFAAGEKEEDRPRALVTGIDENCHLLVRFDDGRCEALSSGEVSVRR